MFHKFIFVIIIITVSCIIFDAQAGDWHDPDQLICSDCHTMHYSEGGMIPMGAQSAGPFSKLLLASTTNALCLTCHDGTDSDAPDVVYPVTYTSDPAGGYFANSGGTASDDAHNLGMASGETPPGSSDSLTLSCASCHSPHGNSNYRNLLPNPAGSGNTGDVNIIVSQGTIADGSNPEQVYIPSNIVYRSGMSEWCSDCHPDFHGADDTGSPEPWFRHPQESTVSGGGHADYDHWEGASVLNRIQVQSPDDTIIPSPDDQVFCLSCHKTHGSEHKSSLILADGDRMLSTCQQCHNQPYEDTRHEADIRRLSTEPTGDCTHCHDEHASRDGQLTQGGPHDYLLFTQNDNSLCYTSPCHNSPGDRGIYEGETAYINSHHGNVNESDGLNPTSGKRLPSCQACHNPHGVEADGTGEVFSSYLVKWAYGTGINSSDEELLCFGGSSGSGYCHSDNSPYAPQTESSFEGTATASPGTTGKFMNTHHDISYEDQVYSGAKIECHDCHNDHATQVSEPGPEGIVKADPDPDDVRIPTAGSTWFDSSFLSEWCLDCHDNSFPSTVTPPNVELEDIYGAWTGMGQGGDMANRHGSRDGTQQVTLREGSGYARGDILQCSDCHFMGHPESNLFQLKTRIYSKDGLTQLPSNDTVDPYGDVQVLNVDALNDDPTTNGEYWCSTCHPNGHSGSMGPEDKGCFTQQCHGHANNAF
jgi:predicted CXXCH cytochrome family protein